MDATFAAFGIDADLHAGGGEPVSVRVIARRPDTIVGFGETRIHAETVTFELRANEVANPHPSDQLTVGGNTFVFRVSRNGAIPIGSCGAWMLSLHEIAAGLNGFAPFGAGAVLKMGLFSIACG